MTSVVAAPFKIRKKYRTTVRRFKWVLYRRRGRNEYVVRGLYLTFAEAVTAMSREYKWFVLNGVDPKEW